MAALLWPMRLICSYRSWATNGTRHCLTYSNLPVSSALRKNLVREFKPMLHPPSYAVYSHAVCSCSRVWSKLSAFAEANFTPSVTYSSLSMTPPAVFTGSRANCSGKQFLGEANFGPSPWLILHPKRVLFCIAEFGHGTLEREFILTVLIPFLFIGVWGAHRNYSEPTGTTVAERLASVHIS